MIEKNTKRTGLWITLGVIGFVVLLLLGSLVFVAVTMNNLSDSIEQTQVEVVAAYKARSEAVEKLVNAIKPGMSAEQKAFDQLKNAEVELEKASGTKALSDANLQVDIAINNLIYVMIDKYYHLETPEILELEKNIDSARNRIVTESTDYNKVAKDYNFAVQNFPGDFISRFAGHKTVDLFQIVNYGGSNTSSTASSTN